MKKSALFSGAIFAAATHAQQAAYGQCGGQGWTGATTCVSGYHCTTLNPYYFQCVPGSASSAQPTAQSTAQTTLATSTIRIQATSSVSGTASTTAVSAAASGTGLRWVGVDESGAEFGQSNLPGTYGVDYIFPSTSTIDTLIGEGYNIFRLPFLMERMAPASITGALSTEYLANYSAVVNYITGRGAHAVLDPHNYGRYNGNIITDTTSFGTFWSNVASAFASNSRVIFDTNNEYHDMDETLVLNLNQAAINAIRAAGATTQYIFVEGNSYSGGWTWNTTNTALSALTDSENLIIYEMHQYLDSDGSGTSATCVSSTIGVERIEGATAWLRANGKLGVLGEFAGGANSVCLTAVTGMLQHLAANTDVWTGALWWGGGPWWGDSYIYAFEPPSGIGYEYYDATLRSFAP